MSSRGGTRSGCGRKLLTPRSRLVSKEKKKKTKKRWEDKHRKLYMAADVHSSWKRIKCMCLYSTDTAFAQHLLSLEMRRRVGLLGMVAGKAGTRGTPSAATMVQSRKRLDLGSAVEVQGNLCRGDFRIPGHLFTYLSTL